MKGFYHRVLSVKCSLEVSERMVRYQKEGCKRGNFKGVLTHMNGNNGQGLLKAKINLLVNKLFRILENSYPS